MIQVEGAFATSHAFAFMPTVRWDEFRGRLRTLYRERYGSLPDEPEQVQHETDDGISRRHAKLTDIHDAIADRIRSIAPDAIVLIGNDQNENYGEFAIPQFAMYTGDRAVVSDWLSEGRREYEFDGELARDLLAGCITRGFDVVQTRRFVDDTLLAHAHTQVLFRLLPEGRVPIVSIFVNAITTPLASPARCFEFGRALAYALSNSALNRRIVVGVSGGLSHFTFGYPYAALSQPRTIGTICSEFDARLLECIRAGRLDELAGLTDADLLDNGDVEFRQALSFFGILAAGTRPADLHYDALYRGMTGMWAGWWDRPALASAGGARE